jgi:hypothetical protein
LPIVNITPEQFAARSFLDCYYHKDGWDSFTPSEESVLTMLKMAGFADVKEFREWQKTSGGLNA